MQYTMVVLWTKRLTNSKSGNPRVAVATYGGDTRWTEPDSHAGQVALGLKKDQTIEVTTGAQGLITEIRTI